MSLRSSAFPSSAAFDTISSALIADESGRKDAIKKGGAIFAFTLKNGAGEEESWYIDLKETGVVGRGIGPEGKPADVTLCMSEQNFGLLVAGSANAQRLFMAGKLRVKGDVMKATRVEVVLKKIQPKAKL
ncbi:MAG: hypothetical protein M1839_000605 [Geoglossum umbratile]|nr:MAG: hypothetical protein M1839_000605 [Geoglossum umbratile]